MALTIDRSSLRLFGTDLSAVPRYLREGWAEALRWPALRWLTPDDYVRVVHADGTESIRFGVTSKRAESAARIRFVAVELDEAQLLRRSLELPQLTEAELRQAIELDVRAASPFPEEDLAWGYEVVERNGRLRVETVLTSRPLIEQRLAAVRPRLGLAVPEVWAGGDRPIVIPGYGEAARTARARRRRLMLFGQLFLAALLLAALAITPTLQLRAQALEATRRTDELSRTVMPQAKMREELARLGEQVQLLSKAGEPRRDVVALLDQLTRLLPDDVVVNRLEISGSTVKIIGQADNAAQLLQTLGADPAFRDVRAPSGIARAPAGSKEGFTIEFRVAGEGKAP